MRYFIDRDKGVVLSLPVTEFYILEELIRDSNSTIGEEIKIFFKKIHAEILGLQK